ncbi:MAG: hypothetical protein K8I29_19775 [Alphaproteobacteria bacterium]|uniref:Uncharacterized protein n=1 Tax=Candidatus Nitrobium versatile TaxID=2884831 RepID=A0A953SIG8_9BACT|nr:hypothetical protein [Candidatus Nitrobium versatile]
MEDNALVAILKELVGNLCEKDREKVLECAARVRGVLAEYPEHRMIAFALVGAEMSGEVSE